MAQQSAIEKLGYKQELKRSLSFWDLLIYGLIFMVPIAPFGIYGDVVTTSKGMVALAYLIGMVGMIFTALSYARMSEAFPIAGSVYAYAGKGINQYVGFVAGWSILLDYILVPALLYVVSAQALTGMVPGVPSWVWLVVFIVINTIINYFGIEFTAKANIVILIFELIVLALFIVIGIVAIAKGVNGAEFSFKPLYDPDYFSMHLVMSAVSIAVLSFLGFDAISTLSEETKGGVKSIGRATIASLLIVGVLFMVQTWIAALVFPDFNSFDDIGTAFYQVADIAGGGWLGNLTAIAIAIAWGIADALVAQAAISRVLYSMARDRKLPRFLAKVHPKYKTPYISTVIVAIISLIVGIAFISNVDVLSSFVNFGALTAFLFLHVSVFIHYIIKNKSRDYWNHFVLPLIGFVIIGYVWISLATQAKILGLSWLAIGIIIAIIFAVQKKDTSLDLH
ncbi:amino acid transporter [Pullulanibacillus pueri]|uniref:Porin n=1 Tax=Pullulanibacillus pueri TaxID=1437324 RepID=A0A8J3EMC2_9BACL|nr:APC family permease [Pullulanibacillus pueri]MBM7682091.1 amino acid transporter [Pullulanibacillus pueri]GGH80017.1 porin [Pullulanibacillus pueri]